MHSRHVFAGWFVSPMNVGFVDALAMSAMFVFEAPSLLSSETAVFTLTADC